MAKKEEKTTAVAMTEENVMDTIRKGNLLDEEIIKLGDEKDSQEEKDRKVAEYRRAKNKAKYQNFRALLQLRARRREEKATKQWLNDTKSLFDDLCSGKITPLEYEEQRRKAVETKDKTFTESADTLRKEVKELQRQFPGYWCYDWED